MLLFWKKYIRVYVTWCQISVTCCCISKCLQKNISAWWASATFCSHVKLYSSAFVLAWLPLQTLMHKLQQTFCCYKFKTSFFLISFFIPTFFPEKNTFYLKLIKKFRVEFLEISLLPILIPSYNWAPSLFVFRLTVVPNKCGNKVILRSIWIKLPSRTLLFLFSWWLLYWNVNWLLLFFLSAFRPVARPKYLMRQKLLLPFPSLLPSLPFPFPPSLPPWR